MRENVLEEKRKPGSFLACDLVKQTGEWGGQCRSQDLSFFTAYVQGRLPRGVESKLQADLPSPHLLPPHHTAEKALLS